MMTPAEMRLTVRVALHQEASAREALALSEGLRAALAPALSTYIAALQSTGRLPPVVPIEMETT